jgi:hypothetical protein
MAVISEKSFQLQWPQWVNDPECDGPEKQMFLDSGMGEPFTESDAVQIADTCFICGKPLTLPYVYWSGCGEKVKSGSVEAWEDLGISLHETCARTLAKGILRDADEITNRNQNLNQ